ncbi:MAG: FbpB family small basic protein [Bacillaceae bacterium]|nr:FbpB family small basic protein [Bacillaceae bacterium]
MRKIRKLSFEELVQENKRQLMNDKEALERIEERWEQKIQKENGVAF